MAARGVLVVCDLTRENTFEAVAKWKAEIDEWASIERNLNIPVVLIANKVRNLPPHHESTRISFRGMRFRHCSFLATVSICSFFPQSLPPPSLLLTPVFLSLCLCLCVCPRVVYLHLQCDLLTDASASFLAGANMVHMCHSQRFSSWYVTSALNGSNVINAFADLVERAMAQPTVQVRHL
jgi:hypothetical protein